MFIPARFIPDRGEVWRLAPPGQRPLYVLIISERYFNGSRDGLAFALPLTDGHYRHEQHVEIRPPQCGFDRFYWVQCERITTVKIGYLQDNVGMVSGEVMDDIEERLRGTLRLYREPDYYLWSS